MMGFRRVCVLLLWLCVTGVATAQEYAIEGDIELFSAAVHFRNAYFVDFGKRNLWLPTAGLRGNLTHRLELERAELRIDHRLTAVNAGFGASAAQTDPSAVALRHDLYHGAVALFATPELTVTIGRHRLPWGIEYTRSVSDSLHPTATETDARIGFDGVSLVVVPHPVLAMSGAVAFQNAIARQNMEYTRTAARAELTFEAIDVWTSIVSQYRSTLRHGVGTRLRIGPVVLSGETAVEHLPPPGSIWRAAPLTALAAETGWKSADWDLSAIVEYRFNGLSDTAPRSAAAVPRMSDNAGGFDLLGSEYVFAAGRIAYRRVSVDQRMLVNLSDRSSVLFDQRFNYAATRDAELTLRLVWPWGSPLTEFGTTLDDFVVVAAVKVALPSGRQ